MDKKVKELIQAKKLSDEQLLAILEAYNPEAEEEPADEDNGEEQSSSEEAPKVESTGTDQDQLAQLISDLIDKKLKGLAPKGKPKPKPTKAEAPSIPKGWGAVP